MRSAAASGPGSVLASELSAAGVRAGDDVVAAFSGGADSLALLALLAGLPAAERPRIEAVHVDHGLRPSSAAEAERALAVARSLGFEARVVRVSVARRGGVEAAARHARYRALAEVAAGRPILTAHTLDDQAETVLLRLARGTGLRGAAGIRPDVELYGGRVLRPLLHVRRDELRAVVEALGLPVVEDPTNADLRFARNRLRAEVLPALTQVAPGAVQALARFADLAAADERYLRSRVRKATERLGGVALDVAKLRALPLALRRRVVRTQIQRVSRKPPEAARVAEVLELLERGGELHLPGSVRVTVRDGHFRAASGPTGRAGRKPAAPAGRLPDPLSPASPVQRQGLVLHVEGPPDAPPARHDPATLWTSLPPPYAVREVRRGERLPVPGTGHRLASDLLSEARVPRDKRPRALIVEANGRPIWLVGVRPLCLMPPEGAAAGRLRASSR